MEIGYTDAPFENVSPGCIELLKGMLHKDQNDRWNINDVLAHPWVVEALN